MYNLNKNLQQKSIQINQYVLNIFYLHETYMFIFFSTQQHYSSTTHSNNHIIEASMESTIYLGNKFIFYTNSKRLYDTENWVKINQMEKTKQ